MESGAADFGDLAGDVVGLQWLLVLSGGLEQGEPPGVEVGAGSAVGVFDLLVLGEGREHEFEVAADDFVVLLDGAVAEDFLQVGEGGGENEVLDVDGGSVGSGSLEPDAYEEAGEHRLDFVGEDVDREEAGNVGALIKNVLDAAALVLYGKQVFDELVGFVDEVGWARGGVLLIGGGGVLE